MTGVPVQQDVLLRPITSADVVRVAAYLHRELNPRLSAEDWAAAIVPPWSAEAPNHGFMLLQDDRVVGANIAFYSTRSVAGEERAFCNVAALCVDEAQRLHTVRLVRAILRQPGQHFTDFSPSGNVVELDRRLGFRPLDDRTALVMNVPLPRPGIRLVTDGDEIEGRLTGCDLQVFVDHREALAARHLLLTRGDDSCYVVFRKDRRKGLPLFASILHVSNPALFAAGFGSVAGHLLRQGAVLTLLERRVADVRPAFARTLSRARPKMFKSATLEQGDVDYLYSELTCVPW